MIPTLKSELAEVPFFVVVLGTIWRWTRLPNISQL